MVYQRPTLLCLWPRILQLFNLVFIVSIDQVLHDNMLPVICGRQEAMKSANCVTGSILTLPLSPPLAKMCTHTHKNTLSGYCGLTSVLNSQYRKNAQGMSASGKPSVINGRASTVEPLYSGHPRDSFKRPD